MSRSTAARRSQHRIVPIFIPHLGCPNDCVFCDQRGISGYRSAPTAADVETTLRTAIETLGDASGIEVAFYGGSFTALDESAQDEYLAAVQRVFVEHEYSVRVSTRPDCISDEIVRRLISRGVRTIELGAQSMCDEVLQRSGRGHTAHDTVVAAQTVKRCGATLILQMMTGLPGDDRTKSLETARKIAALKPDGVRIYPTVVVRETPLFELWRSGEYREHSVAEAVELCAEIYEEFMSAGIPVIRMGLNPSDGLSAGDAVAGAYHPAFGELVYSRVYLTRARTLLNGIKEGSAVVLGVAPGRMSVMVGQKRCNIDALMQEFLISDVRVREIEMPEGEIVVVFVEKNGNVW